MKFRILSMILVLCMLLSFIASAAYTDTTEEMNSASAAFIDEILSDPLSAHEAPDILSCEEKNSSVSTEIGDDDFEALEQLVKYALLTGKSAIDVSPYHITSFDDMRSSPFWDICSRQLTGYDPSSECYTKLLISNPMSAEQMQEAIAQLEASISYMDGLVAAQPTEERKALALHDYMILEYAYDETYTHYSMASMILDKKGVCAAYTKLYQYILRKAGMECLNVSSTEMNHSWNIVRVNGAYYHVDVTWDDPISDKPGQVRHGHFLLSDEAIQTDRNGSGSTHYGWDRQDIICNSTQYDEFFWKDVRSPVILHDGNFYYVSSLGICTRNMSTDKETVLRGDLGVWPVLDKPGWTWNGVFSGLFLLDGYLYYNTATEIRKISLDGLDDVCVLSPDTSDGKIYSCLLRNGCIFYLLAASPSEAGTLLSEHSYTEHNYVASVTEPTCIEKGYTTYTCACGDSYVDDYVDALGHDIVTDAAVAATCTETGLTEGCHCSRCDYKIAQKTVAALGHDEIHHDGKAATCTEKGWKAYDTCSRCDYTTYKEIPATGHSYNTVVTAPTCTEKGYTTYTCKCGDSYVDDYVDALGHDIVTDPAAPATCTESGLTEGCHCSRCDYKIAQKTVAALGHDEIHHDEKAATCTEKGWEAYVTCSRCDYSTYKEILATGHSYTETITAPTCTEKGYTTYACACGDTYVADYVDALGHDIVADPAVSATCTESGLTEGWHCSRCDYKIAQNTVAALGHDIITDSAVAATCTETGLTEGCHCSRCDYEIAQNTVAVLGHDEIHHDGKAATCTEKGWEAYVTCSRCDYSTYKEILAAGHSYTATITAPTCTEKGYTTYICTCGDSCVDNYVDALGHDFVDGECTRCGEEYPDCVAPDVPWKNPFVDVPQNAWYYDSVKFACQNGLFSGMSAITFEPDTEMTRAMLVTVLWRMDGKPDAEGKNPFTDILNNQWFTEAVIWASENGIVNGMGNNKFAPDDPITREQMAAILYRYAAKKDYDTSKTADLSSFIDGASVSSWARESLSWANAERLINGTSEQGKIYLDPQGNATRAQVAAILMRFLQNVANK